MNSSGHQDQNILDALRRHVACRPEAPAYRSGDELLSFSNVEQTTNQIANALAAMNVGAGDRVACLTRHHMPCLLLMLAACKLGAVCMPVNWRLAAGEVAQILEHGQAKFAMVDAAFIGLVQAQPAGATDRLLQKLVCTDGSLERVERFAAWYAPHDTSFTAMAASPDDAALQLYSSGTTGLPKGVVLSHRGLLSASRAVAQAWQVDGSSVIGNPLPTFHVAGTSMLLLSLYAGAQSVTCSEFAAASFIRDIAAHGITHCFLVPVMLMFMLQRPEAAQGNYRSLKLISYGAAPISETVLRDSMRVFQCDFLQVYGLTEVSGPATFLMPADHRASESQPELLRSAGQAIEGARLRIVDPASLADVPDGVTGEVLIEAAGNLKEYWRDTVATSQAFPEGRNERGGWFRTGDAGYLKDGYLFINDRIKDMIISGGENIYPAEIENLLMKHPAVADGAIIGVPDTTWGEAVKACVVLKPGQQVSERDIIDWMRERLAHFKCPKTVDFVGSLPRNPSGKLLKRVLREPYWAGKTRSVA
jgi:acyl-CoA synthetase (AMP-forming)/AMP-acid ligase II